MGKSFISFELLLRPSTYPFLVSSLDGRKLQLKLANFKTRNKGCNLLKMTKIWERVNKMIHAFELAGRSSAENKW